MSVFDGKRLTNDTFHDVGVATKDLGRGRAVKDDPLMQYAFKTPTLRSVALRAPYLHDGSAADLEAVVKHYEKGGIDRPSRSPLIKPIALTDQERRILDLIAEGMTNRQIGEQLFLAEKTVKNYVSNLLSKLGMSRRTEAAAYAARLAERKQRGG